MRIADILSAAGIGVGATLVMDGWNLFLARAFGIPSLDLGLLGRWLLHIPTGKLRHASIRAADSRPAERAIGWAAHDSIGIALATAFVLVAPPGWLGSPTLLPALAFGLVTIVFPFLVLQPALGLGVASSKTPQPGKARLKSLASHTAFGLGLYFTALVVNLAKGATGPEL